MVSGPVSRALGWCCVVLAGAAVITAIGLAVLWRPWWAVFSLGVGFVVAILAYVLFEPVVVCGGCARKAAISDADRAGWLMTAAFTHCEHCRRDGQRAG